MMIIGNRWTLGGCARGVTLGITALMDEETQRVNGKWLCYGYTEDSPNTKVCWNMGQPFHTMEQARQVARLAEPWQKPFLRFYADWPLTEEDLRK